MHIGFLRFTALSILAVTPLAFGAGKAVSGCSQMTLGQSGSLDGFLPFPTTDAWRQTVTSAPVAANSAAIIGLIGSSKLHPDFGAADGDSTYGIPYSVVSGARGAAINYTAFGDQSDPGPMPIPASSPVEGGPNSDGDRHVLVVDRDNCFLYELYNAHVQGDGSWNADSGVAWDLINNEDRPYSWTSADAAGLPIFPGLARYDEVTAGAINHALRFTLQRTAGATVAPATHFSKTSTNPAAAPMGTRLRLRADFDISRYPAQARVVLAALKTYGMILADNGSNMFLSGTSDNRWDNDDLHSLGKVPASAFEVVDTSSSVSAKALVAGVAPVISALTASATQVAAGASVQLQWATSGGSSFLVTPEVGAIRGNSTTVHPMQTTTYTVYATNHFGRTARQITVTVK